MNKKGHSRVRKDILDELRDINATAKRLGGVAPSSVKLWISQKRLEKTKVAGRTMVSESAVRRFLEGCQ